MGREGSEIAKIRLTSFVDEDFILFIIVGDVYILCNDGYLEIYNANCTYIMLHIYRI